MLLQVVIENPCDDALRWRQNLIWNDVASLLRRKTEFKRQIATAKMTMRFGSKSFQVNVISWQPFNALAMTISFPLNNTKWNSFCSLIDYLHIKGRRLQNEKLQTLS